MATDDYEFKPVDDDEQVEKEVTNNRSTSQRGWFAFARIGGVNNEDRSVRQSYQHSACGSVTTMSPQLAEAFAQDPKAFDVIYCGKCHDHHSVDEFVWLEDGSVTDKKVG